MEGKIKKGIGLRALDFIEEKGNKLWDPITLFVVLCMLVLLISLILGKLGISAIHPATGEPVVAVNLLSKQGLQSFIANIVGNYQSFPPLVMVIIVMMGAGLADKVGLMQSFIKNSVLKAPKNLVTAIVVLIGINAVAVADAGFVLLPPLAAVVYLGLGRHPLAGLYTAFASVAAGFAACMIIQMGDILAAAFTLPAAQLINPDYISSPAMNYYFMLVSAIILTPVGVWVNNRIIEPRLGEYKGGYVDDKEVKKELSLVEKKGLRWSGVTMLLIVAVIVALSIGKNAFFADPETGSLVAYTAPLMTGIVPLVTIFFLVPAFVYGIIVGKIKRDKDAINMISESISELGPYIVLAFFAAQFLALFSASNMGALISIKGAELLQNIGFTGLPLLISFILFACIVNLFIGSASAKWAILAPMFVPMFMLLGYDPALTQLCYRIGDSLTNPLTPLFPYFPILLGFVKRYDNNAGIGTIIANMIPYSLAFGVVWVVLLIVFFIFNIPLGPGGGIFIS